VRLCRSSSAEREDGFAAWLASRHDFCVPEFSVIAISMPAFVASSSW